MFGIIRSLINIVFGIIELLLGLRFIFKFFVVNAGAPFIVWIYGVTAGIVSPFIGIVPNLNLGGFVIDFATLIALIIYSLIGYFLLQLFSYAGSRYF